MVKPRGGRNATRMQAATVVVDVIASINNKRDEGISAMRSAFEKSKSEMLAGFEYKHQGIRESLPVAEQPALKKARIVENNREQTTRSASRSGISDASNTKLPPTSKPLKSVAIPSITAHEDHPEYSRVMALKVIGLRDELKAMSLATTGLKKELRERLLDGLIDRDSKIQVAAVADNESDDGGRMSTESIKSTSDDVARMSTDSIKSTEDETMAYTSLVQKNTQSSVSKDTATARNENEYQKTSATTPEESAKLHQRPATASEKAKKYDKKEGSNRALVKHPSLAAVTSTIVKTATAIFSPKKSAAEIHQPNDVPRECPAAKPQKVTLFKDTTNVHDSDCKGKVGVSKLGKVGVSKLGVSKMVAMFEGSQTTSSNDANAKPALASKTLKSVSKSEPTEPTDEAAFEQKHSTKAKSGKTNTQHFASDIQIPILSKPLAMSMPGKSNPVSSSKQKLKKHAEARQKRLAEMRGKSKPVAATTATVSDVNKAGATKLLNSKTAASAQKRGNGLAAKMREKHAAQRVVKDAALLPPPKDIMKHPAKAQMLRAAPESPPAEKVEPPSFQKAVERSPMQTYEISDVDSSDDESQESSRDDSTNDKIPEWAQKKNLMIALQKQYSVEAGAFDPDTIFPEVETCDLEEVFSKRRNRYKHRNSTGIWGKDRLTSAEKEAYKRKMGYAL